MDNKNLLSKGFLLLLLTFVLLACFLIFKSFFAEIIVATILVTLFYPLYQKLLKKTGNKKKLSSFVMCLMVVLLVIVPVINFIIFSAHKSVEAYTETIYFINNNNIQDLVKSNILERFDFLGIDIESIKDFATSMVKQAGLLFYEGASRFVIGTTGFMISLFWIVLTMFFFFMDGPGMLKKLMCLTPLSNKYDREIFVKFKNVSYSIMVSTFVTAIVQGFLGALAFVIVGLPAFFAGVFMALFSLVPYIGPAIIWLPTAIILLINGMIWQGIFMIIWGAVVVGLSDNIIRAYLIKDSAQVHPLFVIFAIIGGISLFGFWGIIFGPLIISLAVTVLHIYEIEFADVLEK